MKFGEETGGQQVMKWENDGICRGNREEAGRRREVEREVDC